ncbi:MAG: hypothetical protein ACYCOU_06110 [Sulfobacillus sp.]
MGALLDTVCRANHGAITMERWNDFIASVDLSCWWAFWICLILFSLVFWTSGLWLKFDSTHKPYQASLAWLATWGVALVVTFVTMIVIPVKLYPEEGVVDWASVLTFAFVVGLCFTVVFWLATALIPIQRVLSFHAKLRYAPPFSNKIVRYW